MTNSSVTAANDTGPATRKDYPAEFRVIDVARDGKSMRLRFATIDGEIGVCVAPDNLSGMIPLLLRAEAQGYKNAGVPDAIRPFITSDAAVSVCPDGKHLTISMILPGDRGRIGFHVDRQIARGLLRILAKALGETAAPLPRSHTDAERRRSN
jgi:hypothetical protein